jgi:hypothetical protein
MGNLAQFLSAKLQYMHHLDTCEAYYGSYENVHE